MLIVLAPDHTALTVSEEPSLYWFISKATSHPVEIVVMDPGTTQPLLEARLPAPIGPGVHRVRLADHGVRLASGVPYRWYVAIVPDDARRSRDILAGGIVQRVEPTVDLGERVARAPKEQLPQVYAEAGLWYDALDALSAVIERAPGDVALVKQRAGFLAQAGLPQIAQEDSPPVR
jgi:hypothetical protein